VAGLSAKHARSIKSLQTMIAVSLPLSDSIAWGKDCGRVAGLSLLLWIYPCHSCRCKHTGEHDCPDLFFFRSRAGTRNCHSVRTCNEIQSLPPGRLLFLTDACVDDRQTDRHSSDPFTWNKLSSRRYFLTCSHLVVTSRHCTHSSTTKTI